MAKRSLIQMATGWYSRTRRGDNGLRLNALILIHQAIVLECLFKQSNALCHNFFKFRALHMFRRSTAGSVF